METWSPFVDELLLVIAHTDIKRHSVDFYKALSERWLEGKRNIIDGYAETAHMVREGKKALLNKN